MLVISLALHVFITYFLRREQSWWLLGSYSLLFAAYIILAWFAKEEEVKALTYSSLLFRFSLLLALPNLSDDIYRFVWDGRLLAQGINPFTHLPLYYADKSVPGLDLSLFAQLNSPEYFTIYPPVAQFTFWLSALIAPNSVWASGVVMRLFNLAAETGTLLLIPTLLKIYGLPEKNALWYALNPLIILELTGNLHHEALMIFFLVASFYLLTKSRLVASAATYGLAVCSKLIPLIFLPLMLQKLGWKRAMMFYTLTGLVTLVCYTPLVSQELIDGMRSSFSLYFQKFEFNASIYYLVREIGFAVRGYNIIQTAGPRLALATFLLILGLTAWGYWKKKPLRESMLWILMVYLALITTLHPWYVSTALILAVFTRYRFPVLWTFLVFFTYLGYHQGVFEENYWITIIEYTGLMAFLIWEFSTKRNAPRENYAMPGSRNLAQKLEPGG